MLRALRAELPLERFVYIADSGHAPYGERDDSHIIARSHAITRYLQAQHHIKALVVACNTATAAARSSTKRVIALIPLGQASISVVASVMNKFLFSQRFCVDVLC